MIGHHRHVRTLGGNKIFSCKKIFLNISTHFNK